MNSKAEDRAWAWLLVALLATALFGFAAPAFDWRVGIPVTTLLAVHSLYRVLKLARIMLTS